MFKSKGTGFNCKDGTKESKVAKRKFLNEDIKQEMRLMHMASGMIHFKNGKDTDRLHEFAGHCFEGNHPRFELSLYSQVVRVAVGVVHDAWYQGGGECVRLL